MGELSSNYRGLENVLPVDPLDDASGLPICHPTPPTQILALEENPLLGTMEPKEKGSFGCLETNKPGPTSSNSTGFPFGGMC